MHEVSARSVKQLLEMAAHQGVPASALLEGLPQAPAELTDPARRVDWSTYLRILYRCRDAVGGRDGLVRMGAHYTDTPAMRFVARLAGYFTSCRQLYWFLYRWVGPYCFAHITPTLEDLPGGRMRIRPTLPDEHEDAPDFWWLSYGSLTVMPRFLGQDDAVIHLEVGTRAATYTITLPPSLTLWARLRCAFKAVFAPHGAIEELRRQHDQVTHSYQQLSAMHRDYRHLIERMPVGVVVHQGGRVLFANDAFARALGLASPDALAGRTLAAWLQGADAAAWQRLVAATDPAPAAVEIRFAGADGQPVDLEVQAVPRLRFGDVPAGLLLAQDITLRRALEQQGAAISQQERQRFARDLHDGLGPLLTVIGLKSKALEGRLADGDPALKRVADDLVRLAEEAGGQADTIARGLRPVTEGPDGLVDGLTDLAAFAREEFQIDCRYEDSDEPAGLPGLAGSDLYRIAQEAVHNAVHHGRATVVTIRTFRREAQLVLQIRDNGQGFEIDAPTRRGMGLANMQYRARLIGGRLTLARNEAGGVDVECAVPVTPATRTGDAAATLV